MTTILVTLSVAAVIVGTVKYPEPPTVTVTLAIAPLRTVQVATALAPDPLVITIVGGVVYPMPPSTILILAS